MWRFVRQQNIDRYRKQIAETTDPFRRARLQLLLEEELAKVAPPASKATPPDETNGGKPPKSETE